MKYLAAAMLLLLLGCGASERVSVEQTTSAETVLVFVPRIDTVLSATMTDSLSIVTDSSSVGTVTVTPDVKGKTGEQIQKVKEAVREIKKWDVRVQVTPPPVEYVDKDTAVTIIKHERELTIWETTLGYVPLILFLLLLIGIVLLIIKWSK